ncbi:putative protein phosphatase 2C 8 [Bidens hawaiensis]|uniref:putative protein phosphatase 2C 8 n=1 Tax=Bidens hawaiensis TaxID=980011 RepID=UPI0040495426
MMINNMDHAIPSSPAFNNCRQTAGCSGGSDVARRAELRRSKVSVPSQGDESLFKRKRFEVCDSENTDSEFPQRSCVIGRRREMEDAVSVVLGFINDNDSRKFDFYGVYDGHGGSRVANGCRERLHKVLAAEMAAGSGRVAELDWEKLMVESFEKMDEEVNESELVGSMGSTATVAVVGEEVIVVANCGDSRAVLSRGGAALPLSNDHKPDRPDELEKIERSGGRVVNWNGQRVMGVLATSRSIGDRQLNPYVIAKPEVTVTKREDGDEFMILASDGLWDVISNDLACHVVRKCIDGRITYRRRSQQLNDNQYRLANAATVLTELAMARGSKDNISVIVVNLKD